MTFGPNAPKPNDAPEASLVVTHQPLAYAPIFQPPPIRPNRRHNQEPDLNPGFLWSTWSRWWKVLIPVSLLIMVATCGVLLTITSPQYRAEAYLTISPQHDFLVTPTSREESGRSFVNTQIEILRSPVVLSKILGKPEVASLSLMNRNGAVNWLREHLEIVSKEDSELCRVAVTTSDPDASAVLVNAIVQTYLQLQEEKELARNSSKVRKLHEIMIEQQRIVTDRQSELKNLLGEAFEKDPGARTPLDHHMIVESNPLTDLQKELHETDLEISITRAEIAGMEDGMTNENRGAKSQIHRMVEADPSLTQLKLQLNQKRDSLTKRAAITKGKVTDGGNSKMQREVTELERRIDATRKSLSSDYTEQFASLAKSQHQDLLNEAAQRLNMLAVKQKHLQAQMVQRRIDMKDSSEHVTGVEFAQNKYDEARSLLSKISERLAQLETESGAASRVQLTDPATRPNVPEPMGLWKTLLCAIAASLVMPFGLAVLWERAACRITSADQLENQIELPVIGEVARLPVRVKAGNRTRNASERSLVMFEESIDSIRTNLLLHKEKNHLQVIAICSAVAAEGKTSVSSQLAISLARASGQPALLIDGDMRAPDLHGVFEVPNEPGLMHVLSGDVSAQVAINRNWSEHVHILPAGNLTTSPHNLLGQLQFQNLLDELRTQYRYIIVDTPPILAASEALIMAAAADGVLVCTMHEKSRGDHLRLTHDRLVAAGAKLVGTVLNGVSTRAYAYKYGSYSYGDSRNRNAYNRS